MYFFELNAERYAEVNEKFIHSDLKENTLIYIVKSGCITPLILKKTQYIKIYNNDGIWVNRLSVFSASPLNDYFEEIRFYIGRNYCGFFLEEHDAICFSEKFYKDGIDCWENQIKKAKEQIDFCKSELDKIKNKRNYNKT